MKVHVKIGFIDKYSHERYIKGQTLDLSEERVKEIMDKGDLIEVMEEPEEELEPEEYYEMGVEREELQKMKVSELRKLAKELGKNDEGKKEDLIDRIWEEKNGGKE